MAEVNPAWSYTGNITGSEARTVVQGVIKRIAYTTDFNHGKADMSLLEALDPQLLVAYHQQVRVRVRDTNSGHLRNGRVTRSTGWKPVLLLMYRDNQKGSSDVLGPNDRVVAIQRNGSYIPV